MPAIIRIGDPVACGDSMGEGSGNVFANNIPVSRVGVDKTVGHPPPHGPTPVISGSPNVYVNNISVDRVGDPIAPHGRPPMAAGSPNVFVNNGGAASTITMDDVTADFYVATASSYRQSGVSAYTAASHSIDDEGAPSDTGGTDPVSTGEVPYSGNQATTAAAAKQEGVDIATPPTTVATAETTTPELRPTGSYNFDDIDAATSFPTSFPVSPNFSLGSLTSSARVSNYPLRSQTTNGRVYSEKDIVKNLRALCYEVLEPLKTMYPSFQVNSGFRYTANGKSQHERGQAADMAMSTTDRDSETAWGIAQAIANSNIPFDQFIFEQNNTIWFHLSYDRTRTAQRRMIMSKPRGQAAPTQGLKRVA